MTTTATSPAADRTLAIPEGAVYGADAACSEERMSLIINGLTNDMQMGQ